MAEKIDINGSFEKGWRHGKEEMEQDGWHYVSQVDEGQPGIQEIKLPNATEAGNWWMRFADASVENPYWDGEDYNKFQRPDFDMKLKSQLPLDEQDTLVIDGDWTFKPYLRGAWMGELLFSSDVLDGRYLFKAQVYPDVVAKYTDDGKVFATNRAAFVYFVFNGQPSELMDVTPPTAGITSWWDFTFDFVAKDLTTFGIGFLCPFALENSGFFCDDWSLEKIEDADAITYERTVHLVPQQVTTAEMREVVTIAFTPKQSITRSVEDAFLKDPKVTKRTVYVWQVDRWGGQQALEDYVIKHHPPLPSDLYYPNFMTDESESASASVSYSASASYSESPSVSPSPEPGLPAPRKGNGIHRQTNGDGLYEYYTEMARLGVGVEWAKLVYGIEDARRHIESGVENVDYRVPVSNQGGYIESMNIDGYLAAYGIDSLEANLNWVTAIEGTNEEDPHREDVQEFEMRLSDEMRRRWGDDLLLISLNMPVGNGDGEKLIHWARHIAANGHYGGYHDYFPVDLVNAEKWMVEEAQWYHLRHLLHIDPVLVANGIKLQWVCTEGGAVRAYQRNWAQRLWARRTGGPSVYLDPVWVAAKQRHPMLGESTLVDGYSTPDYRITPEGHVTHLDVGHLDPGGGWLHPEALNGDQDRYINLLLTKQAMVNKFNAKWDSVNRARGSVIFTFGADFVGWDHFKVKEPFLQVYAAAQGARFWNGGAY